MRVVAFVIAPNVVDVVTVMICADVNAIGAMGLAIVVDAMVIPATIIAITLHPLSLVRFWFHAIQLE